jgi:hypothetical protein
MIFDLIEDNMQNSQPPGPQDDYKNTVPLKTPEKGTISLILSNDL